MTHHAEKRVLKHKHLVHVANQRRGYKGRISSLVIASALAPLVAMTGCASHSENDFTVGSVQSTYKTKHPIIIDEKEKTLDVPIASSSYDLPIPAVSAIQGFATSYKQGSNGLVTILIPSGSPNEAAARGVKSKIVDTLIGEGIPSHRMRTTSYDAGRHGSSAPIRLSFSAVSASVEKCGKWPEDLAAVNNENQNYHNFGCAQQNNMAAMIANPADLLAPRGMTPIDASRRNTAIERYREGDNTLSSPTNTVFN